MGTEQHAPAKETEPTPRVATFASTAVHLGAAALLGGGFYYGIAKQRRIEQEEEAKTKPKKKAKALSQAAKDKVPVIRKVTFLERTLGLHRPVTPNAAAMKALVGGTIVSVSGCAVLLFGLGAVLGVRNMTEFRARMEDVFPRMRNNVARAFNIKPKVRSAQELAEDEAELRELAAIFDEPAEEPIKKGSPTAESAA